MQQKSAQAQGRGWSIIKLAYTLMVVQQDYFKSQQLKGDKEKLRRKLAKCKSLEARLQIEFDRLWDAYPQEKPQINISLPGTQTSMEEWLAQ